MILLRTLNRFLEYLNLEVIEPNPKEAIAFAKRHFKNKEIVACEIGIWKGTTSREINKNLNIEKFYLIDPYKDYDEYHSMVDDYRIAEEIAKRRNKRWEKTNVWIKKTSYESIKEIRDKLDFVYIDGNHAYKYVKEDLNNYWFKLKEGGIMSGHDVDYEEVSRAVIEFVKENDLEIRFGNRTDWWIIKEEIKVEKINEKRN